MIQLLSNGKILFVLAGQVFEFVKGDYIYILQGTKIGIGGSLSATQGVII